MGESVDAISPRVLCSSFSSICIPVYRRTILGMNLLLGNVQATLRSKKGVDQCAWDADDAAIG